MQRLLEDQKKFILVFDNIDRQREAAPTLLPALARLGELVSIHQFSPKKPQADTKPRFPTYQPSSSSPPPGPISSTDP
ncbi:MAG: hypothetical protein Q9198_005595, partial [Flavoplaca austrocitrina]